MKYVETWLGAYIAHILKHRIIYSVMLVGVFIAALIPFQNFGFDNALEIWFMKDDPVLINYQSFQETFGNDEIITIVLQSNTSYMQEENLNQLQKIATELKEQPFIKDIFYLTSNENKAWFLSEDEKTTMMTLELTSITNIDEKRKEIFDFIKKTMTESFPDITYYMAGMGVLYEALNQISMDNSALFVFLSYVLILIMLALFLRRLRLIWIGLTVILYIVVISMSIFFLMGRSINMVTMVLPTLIMMFSVADIIHITHHYIHQAQLHPDKDRKQLVHESIKFISVPCFLASITTALGFSALITSNMPVIQDLGLFAAIGILLAFFISIMMTTLLFSWMPVPKPKLNKTTLNHSISKPALPQHWSSFIGRHRISIIFTSLILFVAGMIGIYLIQVDTYSIQFMKPEHQVRQDSNAIEKSFGYYTPIEFLLTAPEGSFCQPEYLTYAQEVADWLETQPNITHVLTLPDTIPGYNTLKDALKTKDQVLPILNNLPKNRVTRWVNEDYSTLRLSGRTKMDSASGFKEVLDQVKKDQSAVLRPETQLQPSGYIPLYVKMIEYITYTQVYSFLVAFVLVFVAIAIYAGSIRMALLVLLTNLFPLGVTLGIMGFAGIRLDIATVTISAIAIGIVVDDSVHFLYQFKRAKAQAHCTTELALEKTFSGAGKAITTTSVVLVVGFSVLLLAQAISILYFGLLSALVILFAWQADMFLLPALLSQFSPKKA